MKQYQLLFRRLPLRRFRYFSSSPHPTPNPNPRPVPIAQARRNAPAPSVYVETGLRVALVGRPNVGKSTLFNRLASALRGRGSDGAHNPSPLVFVRSVVDPEPGVTRDPRESAAAISDLRFQIIDTAGLEDEVGKTDTVKCDEQVGEEGHSLVKVGAHCDMPAYRVLYQRMEKGTVEAVNNSNLVFFVVDAGEGVTEVDRALAAWLKKEAGNKEVILVANKADKAESHPNVIGSYELGFGDPVVISAEQNLGFVDLYFELNEAYERRKDRGEGVLDQVVSEDEKEEANDWDEELILGVGERKGEEPLQQLVVSILGRPNVGKSTLLNRLAGEERSLVGPAAGVTRDAVLCQWKLPDGVETPDKIPVWLVDTAGIRNKAKVGTGNLERLSVRASMRALRHSHVVVVVLDSKEPLCHQDMKILDVALTEGKALVLVVNKMDTLDVSDMAHWRERLQYEINHKASGFKGVEVVEMSAKEWGDGVGQPKKLFEAVQRARESWEKKITTAALNRFITSFNDRISVGKGFPGAKRNRIGTAKFITQKKIRPPMFRLDGSAAVSLNYLRMLSNAIREEFGFHGVPIRVKRPSRRKRK